MSDQPETPEAETAEEQAQAMLELALEKAKEVVEEADEFTRLMRARSMNCRELITLAEARGKLAEYATGPHVDAIDAAIVRVCDAMGDA